MEFKDYYQTLGVARDAPADVIKKAFRKLARKYHPDVSKEPDAGKRMAEINEANAVLSDPEKRAAYDQLGQQHQVLLSSHSPFVICEAWNGDDQDFIFQMKVEGGHALARTFGDVIKANNIPLGKDKKTGMRDTLSLGNAEIIMSGYMS